MGSENDKNLKILLINSLLTDDIPAYKQYLENISKFDDEEIENFFIGKLDFNYRSVNSKERSFKYLLIKFDKFGPILDNWYQNETKHVYLKQLWKKNPNFEDLKNLNENQRKEKLPFITQWPNEIKNEFNQIIDNYISNDDMILEKVKEYLEGEGKECKELLDIIICAIEKNKQTNTSKIAKKKFELNANNAFYQVIMNSIPIDWATSAFGGISEIYKRLSKKGYNKILDYCRNNNKNVLENIFSLTKKFDKSKISLVSYFALSVANLAWYIYEFNETSNEIDKIEVYKDRLERIKASFEKNSDPKLNFKDDINSANEKIRNSIIKIQKDFDDLIDLISDIEASIKKIKQQKKKAWISTALSITGFISGAVGALLTVGASAGVALAYGAGVGVNLTSCAFNIADIKKACDGIEKLKEVLKEAKEERKKMEEKLNEFLSKEQILYNKSKELKFDD